MSQDVNNQCIFVAKGLTIELNIKMQEFMIVTSIIYLQY
jgi:hypothetical protein